MSKLKHTSGKWKIRTTIDDSGDYPFPTYDILAIHAYGPEGIATTYQNPNNARLIAAAPEMLEVLTNQIKYKCYEKGKRMCEGCAGCNSRSIIEKATGMSIEEVLSERD